jgi:hypothetical protein
MLTLHGFYYFTVFSSTREYTYDGMQRRASETTNGTITDFYYEGDSNIVSYETDGSGNFLRSYTYKDQDQHVTMTTRSGEQVQPITINWMVMVM